MKVNSFRSGTTTSEGDFVNRLKDLGPQAVTIVERLEKLCDPLNKRIGNKYSRKRQPLREQESVYRGASLEEVYPGHPAPFNALFHDCKDIMKSWAVKHPSPSNLVVERVFAGIHQALNAVYDSQLIHGELEFALATALLGPLQKVSSWESAILIASQSSSRSVWGTPEDRKAVNRSLDAEEQYGSPASFKGSRILHRVYSPLEILDKIIYWKPQLCDQFLLWGDKACIRVFGTARDSAVSDSSKKLMDRILPLYMSAQVSVVSGLGDQGIMGEIAGRANKVLNSQALDREKVLIGGIPLRFLTFTGTEQTNTASTTRGAIAPGQIGFESRTPLLYSLGLGVGNFFFPGGLGTKEEAARLLLSQQLRQLVQTPISESGFLGASPNFLIDQKSALKGGSGWFWQPEVKAMEEMLSAGTVNADQIHQSYVIRIGQAHSPNELVKIGGMQVQYFANEEEAANFIFAKSQPFMRSALKRAEKYRVKVDRALNELRMEGRLVPFTSDQS